MIDKPESCSNCPLYNKSRFFTPDTIVENSTITILAQAPGAHEEHGTKIEGYHWEYGKKYEIVSQVTPQPLIGASGNLLRRDFWSRTGIPYDSVSKMNVLKCRPHNANDLPSIGNNKPVNGITVPELKQAITYCTNHHLRFPAHTKHILAMGELSLYALTGEELLHYKKNHHDVDETTGKEKEVNSTITEWRGWALGRDLVEDTLLGLHEYYSPMAGSTLYSRLVNIFPVIHVAALFKNPKLHHATLCDFTRFGQLVRGEWPENLPEIQINEIPTSIPTTIGFDTEYSFSGVDENGKETYELTMWSMADIERNVYVVDSTHSKQLKNVPEKLNLITQNGIVDLPHFLPLIPQESLMHINMEDCMLAHAVQWAGERNSLDYILSKVGLYNRHKHLRESGDSYTKYQYAALDADSTLNGAWRALYKEFRKDKLAWNEYKLRRQPLIYIINRFQERGIKVWKERVNEAIEVIDEKILKIEDEIKLITNNPHFNIKSNTQIKNAIYKGEYATTIKPKLVKEKKVKVAKAISHTSRKKALLAKKTVEEILEEIRQIELQIKLGE